jgi:hypothetical protein
MFPEVETTYDRGELGEAQVRGDKKTVKLRFEKTGHVFSFRRTKKTAKLRPGRWYVQMSSGNDEVFSFHPWSGHFVGKVQGFSSKDGESPTPKLKKVDFYKDSGEHVKYSYTYFVVLIEITEPKKYAGLVVPMRLNYNFREAKDEQGRSITGLASKGSRTAELREFLSISGADTKPLKWSDNVLPPIEKRILRADKSFNFIIKNGWIDTLFEADEPEEVEDWEEDEPTPAPAEVEDDADEEIELDWEEK